MRSRIALLFAVLVAVMGFTAGSALADSIGQCNRFPGNYMSSTKMWLTTLGQENVLQQAKTEIFSQAGFVSVDQSVSQWTSARVMIGNSAKPFSGHDFGCQSGHIFSAGHRSYPRGKAIFYVLPPQFQKGDFSSHRTKAFSVKIRITVTVIGLPDCGNVFSEATTVVEIFVKAKHKKVKKHKKATVKQTNECAAGLVLNANGNCVNQSNTSTQTCGNGQVMSSTGCLTIQINANCSNVVVEGNSNSQGGNCNQAPPPPPPAKEEPKPTPPKFSATQLQEVWEHEGSYTFCVTVTALNASDSGTLTLSPKWGRFEQKIGSVIFTGLHVNDKVCTTFEAGEAPPEGKKEEIAIRLVDDQTHAEAEEIEVFPVTPPPPPTNRG